MELMQIRCKKPIPCQCEAKYKGMAFDGCYFYFTCPDMCKIIQYDKCFCEIDCFNTRKPYSCICYDEKENCFFVSCDQCCNRIFKLDCHFEEIDSITIHAGDCCGGKVTGISYDCKENRLIVSFANCIFSICKSDYSDEDLLRKSCTSWNMGVLSVSPSFIVVEMQNSKQYIVVYDSHSCFKHKYDVPHGCLVESIIFNPCASYSDGKYHFYLLATKNCSYTYVIECILEHSSLEICSCNYEICYKDCEDNPCSPCSKHACTDLIESIALIETSLSHILNAEGEKLQKIIANTNDFDKILCANESISDTIVKITHLEIILHDKLTAIKNCCPICDNGENCCYEPPCNKQNDC